MPRLQVQICIWMFISLVDLCVMFESFISVVVAVLENTGKGVSEPRFDTRPINVTVVAGQRAVLPCLVENLGDYKSYQVRNYH